jgi:polysaccharide biosynthesis protein PelA
VILALLFLIAGCANAGLAESNARPAPRAILAIYDSKYQKDVRDTRIHRLLEMPLNHLGLVVQYQDLNRGLPSVSQMREIRGVLTWFQSDAMERPAEFLSWAEAVIDAGKRFVVIGDLSVGRDLQGRMTPVPVINRFLAKLGVRTENWTPVTYDVQVVYKDPLLMDFERPLPAVLPPFDRVKLVDPNVRSHLILRQRHDPNTDSHLVVTGPHGGLIANGYTHFASYSQDRLQWYVNPFEFLRLAFATDEIPKLDTTTLSGQRIYYSHIDGDGWRNRTEAPAYRREGLMSAEVILKEVIERFPDLPVTVGPIAADLDPAWFGSRESLEIAKRILAIPWVEAGSHTYSHPLDWESLGAQTKTGFQAQALEWLNPLRWTLVARALESFSKPEAEEGKPAFRRGHSRLRSYDLYPFKLDQEIAGSIAFVNSLLPAGKHVELLQWSGTTMESEAVFKAARDAGVRNINGGDTRFDADFASYAWVAPLGRQVGAFRQVYSSMSNENTYTNLWNERYFGFRYVKETVRNTESPIRVKPFNLYYHMYSGEKLASLNALIENLSFARSLQLAPITASEYAAIVDGFFSGRITQLGERRWRVENRDGLNTVRFDHADGDDVDIRASTGVVGERHFQGSLYVALDAADPAPVVALLSGPGPRPSGTPYLIQSRWQIYNLKMIASGCAFEAKGFGPGEMEWNAAPRTRYVISVSRGKQALARFEADSDREGRLKFTANVEAIHPASIQVVAMGQAQ